MSSLYKVIGNYLTELLDVFNNASLLNNNDLTAYFRNIDTNHMKVLLNKVSSVIVKLDTLTTSERQFWIDKLKSSKMYIGFSLTAVIILICGIGLVAAKSFQNASFSLLTKCKVLLSCVVVALVIVTVETVIVISLSTNNKFDKASSVENLAVIKAFCDDLLSSSDGSSSLLDTMLYIGYYNRSAPSQYLPVVKRLTGRPGVVTSGDLDYNALYTSIKTAFESSMTRFYDGGKGYQDIDQQITMSSNVLMLREIRSIVQFYYSIALAVPRQDNLDASNGIVISPAVKSILDKRVVPQLQSLSTSSVSSNLSVTNPSASAIPDDLKNIPTVAALWSALVDDIMFMYLLLLPLYMRTSTGPAYAYKTVIDPDIQARLGVDADAYAYVFEKVLPVQLSIVVMDASQSDACVKVVMQALMPTLTRLNVTLASQVQSRYYFQFDPVFLESVVLGRLQYNEHTYFSGKGSTFYSPFIGALLSFLPTLVANVESSSAMWDMNKINISASTIANSLSSYRFNVTDYNAYIIDQLAIINPENASKQAIGMFNEALTRIAYYTRMRRDIAYSYTDPLDPQHRFQDPETFIASLDTMMFSDLLDGLNVDLFKLLMDSFYNSVSTSIRLGQKESYRDASYLPSKDAYFQLRKSQRIASITVTVAAVVMGLLLLIYFLGKMGSIIDRDAAAVAMAPNREQSATEKVDAWTNKVFSFVFPTVLTVFIIVLMLSYTQKNETRTQFNIETTETNTNTLRGALTDISNLIAVIKQRTGSPQIGTMISQISLITDTDKGELLTSIKSIIVSFEKCNFMVLSAKSQLQVPYTEMSMTIFMIVVLIVTIYFIVNIFEPLRQIDIVKRMDAKINSSCQFGMSPEDIELLTAECACNVQYMESITSSLKIIGLVVVIFSMVFYCIKINQTTSEYRDGLYNSTYFANSECVE